MFYLSKLLLIDSALDIQFIYYNRYKLTKNSFFFKRNRYIFNPKVVNDNRKRQAINDLGLDEFKFALILVKYYVEETRI